jgi:hypothetical protein
MHYSRVRRYGGTGPAGPIGKARPLQQRFEDHVQRYGPLPPTAPQLGSCYLWTGATCGGYGRIESNNKGIYAHRYAYEEAYGPIPEGMEVDHKCRVRLCVRADHLQLATHRQNRENLNAPYRNSSSGVRGVYKHHKKWKAQFNHNGRVYYLGTFTTKQQAAEAVRLKRNELFTHTR